MKHAGTKKNTTQLTSLSLQQSLRLQSAASSSPNRFHIYPPKPDWEKDRQAIRESTHSGKDNGPGEGLWAVLLEQSQKLKTQSAPTDSSDSNYQLCSKWKSHAPQRLILNLEEWKRWILHIFLPENLVQPEIKVYLGWSMGKNHPSDPVHVAGEEFQSSTQVAPAGNLRQALPASVPKRKTISSQCQL